MNIFIDCRNLMYNTTIYFTHQLYTLYNLHNFYVAIIYIDLHTLHRMVCKMDGYKKYN